MHFLDDKHKQNCWREVFVCLDVLLCQQAINVNVQMQIEQVIRLCLSSTDRGFLYAFYEWFLHHNLLDKLYLVSIFHLILLCCMLFQRNPKFFVEFLSNSQTTNLQDTNLRLKKYIDYLQATNNIPQLVCGIELSIVTFMNLCRFKH